MTAVNEEIDITINILLLFLRSFALLEWSRRDIQVCHGERGRRLVLRLHNTTALH